MTPSLTTLSLASATDVAVAALHGRGQYGVVTALADKHGLHRQNVYDLRDKADIAIREALSPRDPADDRRSVTVGEADIKRGVVAMYVEMPASIRDIEHVLPLILGVKWSFGKIQGILAEAQERAADLNRSVDLAAVDTAAMDEMFVRSKPIFSGMDLDTGFVFALEKCPTRTGAEWGEVLAGLRRDQNLDLKAVVKDAGKAMAKACTVVWPRAEQRDDLFHAVYMAGQVARRLEEEAYAAMAKEEGLVAQRDRQSSDLCTRGISQRIRHARDKTTACVDRYDQFEALRRELRGALRMAAPGSGKLRAAAEVTAALERIAADMKALGGKRIRKVATYIANRSQGLASYLAHLQNRLNNVQEVAGGTAMVEAATRAYLASMDAHAGGKPWERRLHQAELDAAVQALVDTADRAPETIMKATGHVFPVLATRHRASSAIENLHSVLRPHIHVHKGAEQGFLDLFRYWWNTRTRRWGRLKGTSATACLTGNRHSDWLSLLGYPPSPGLAAAA